MRKYYSVIPSSALSDLAQSYEVITALGGGLTLLEGHHTPEQLAEIERVGGENHSLEEYQLKYGHAL
jgi:hypothetical protein